MTSKRDTKAMTLAISFERRAKRRRQPRLDYKALANELKGNRP